LDGLQYIQWLEMHSSQLYFFVGNRISEPQQATGQVEWRHMPSAQNPSVKVSSGCCATDLQKTIWFQGSQFLKEDNALWPHHAEPAQSVPEVRAKAISLYIQGEPSQLHTHPSSVKKLRRTCRLLIDQIKLCELLHSYFASLIKF